MNGVDRQDTIMLGDASPNFIRRTSDAFESGPTSPMLGGETKRISTGINPDNLDDSFIPLDRMKTVNL